MRHTVTMTVSITLDDVEDVERRWSETIAKYRPRRAESADQARHEAISGFIARQVATAIKADIQIGMGVACTFDVEAHR